MTTAQQHDRMATTGERRFPMSYENFLAWADEAHAEWVDGEVTVFMPPNIRHQFIAMFLQNLLAQFASAFEFGDVLGAPVEMRAQPDGSAREPDILFVAAAHRDRLTAQRLAGPRRSRGGDRLGREREPRPAPTSSTSTRRRG